MTLALCVLGCGQFARTFARGIQPLRYRLDLYFASRDLSRAREYSRMFQGSGYFGSYEAATADPRVEAVYVCTPHHLHLPHVALAAGRGKHVLVEKPIARTLEEAGQMVEVAAAAGVTLMVAENYRFMATVRQCKGLVDGGVLGDLRLVQLQEEARFTPDEWRSSRDLNGGGVFIDGGIHKVDFLRYLLGEPEQVYAASLPQALPDLEGEDGLVVVTRWPGGAIGLINHSWTGARRPTPPWVSVSGTRGRAYFEPGSSRLKVDRDGAEETLEFAEDYGGLLPMTLEFLDSIGCGREPETSGVEGLKDLAVVLRAYESMEQGVSLPLRP